MNLPETDAARHDEEITREMKGLIKGMTVLDEMVIFFEVFSCDCGINNVLWMSQKFVASPGWLHNEMTKGYMLADIYEGLIAQQQGGSYEAFMQCRYADAFEAKVRNKRNPVLVRGIIAAGGVVVRAAKPFVDDAIKAARPYVDDAVKAAKSAADDVVQGTKSFYQDITTGKSIRNIQTDVSKKTFERNLESSGWSKSPQGGVTHFTKDGAI